MMKAEKEETTCLLDVAGKGNVKTSVRDLVEGITDRALVHKLVIKGGQRHKMSS